MNKGMIGGIGFVAGAEERLRYWTNPYKLYFDDKEKCASAFSDLKWHFAYARLLTISDLVTAISKHNASYSFDAACTWKGSDLPMLGWKSIDTMRMRHRFRKDEWVIEFAECPVNVDAETKEYWRYAYKSPLYDHIKYEWNGTYESPSRPVDEGTSGAVEEENEVDRGQQFTRGLGGVQTTKPSGPQAY